MASATTETGHAETQKTAGAITRTTSTHARIDDDLVAMLGDIKTFASPKEREREHQRDAAPVPAQNLPAQLHSNEIQAAMRALGPQISACFAHFHVPGTVVVSGVIGGGGRMQSSRVAGAFANTPTGDCVARAVRKAAFPRFSGRPISVSYPFILR